MHPRLPLEAYQRIFEAMPGNLLVLLPDPAFTIVGVTDGYLAATLTRRDQILGRSLFDVFPDNPQTPEANSTANLSRSLQRVVDSRAADVMAVQRYDVPRADGGGFELRYWSPVNAPVLGADGQVDYIVHRVDNVTEYMLLSQENSRQRDLSAELSEDKRKMEAEIVERGRELDRVNRELHRANDELGTHARHAREEATRKDAFLAMLAHELRNPLAAISSALQLWELVGRDPQRQAELLAVCRRQMGNLTRMVDDLLDLARVDRGAIELQRVPLDLRSVLDSALHAVRLVLERQRVTVTAHVAPGSYCLSGDPTRIEQILVNLLTNAAKYSAAGGQVEVELDAFTIDDAPWARVVVRDQGRGIPPDQLEAIFGMFVQVDTTLDRSRGGLGIGLSLVRALVERHGGRVRAHSQGIGHGSTFVVELPLAPGACAAAPDPGDGGAPALFQAGRGMRRVLVVEDNADARQMLQALLAASGYIVTTAETGEEGLELIATLKPDVAVIDIGLPGFDGFEVARRARRLPDARGTRLVALTGYGAAATREAALAAGFDDYLVKPFTPALLAAALSAPGG